jgi:hypothetical protein
VKEDNLALKNELELNASKVRVVRSPLQARNSFGASLMQQLSFARRTAARPTCPRSKKSFACGKPPSCTRGRCAPENARAACARGVTHSASLPLLESGSFRAPSPPQIEGEKKRVEELETQIRAYDARAMARRRTMGGALRPRHR